MNTHNYIRISIFVAAVQFINALEFMIIAPVAPYLLKPFNFHLNQIGILTGSYTLCAIFSGLWGFLYLDKFDKKNLLVILLFCLGVTNLLSIFCSNLYMILAVRMLAGIFGGLAGSLGAALLIISISEIDRGKAFSIATLAFPLVSIFGIPGGIWITQHFGYKVLFISISTIIFICLLIGYFLIPASKSTFDKTIHRHLALDSKSILATSLLGIAQFPIYLIIPSLAIILKYNMHVADHNIPFIFMAGGLSSLFITKIFSQLIDRFGEVKPINYSTTIFILTLIFGTIFMCMPPIVFMSVMMGSVYMRLVAASLITSTYPKKHQRGGFSALQSAINNIGSTIAGFLSSSILIVKYNGTLGHVWILVLLATCSALLLPLGLYKYRSANAK
ncbi:MAG: hypothetical protein K0R14_306 [Burkholderiales bacterium]|jgi:predicted MFS family arabinose efflux permease|nr:hypothetical protein [Burkholderiales bacterium]